MTFLHIISMCMFHFKSFNIITPSNFADGTTSMFVFLIVTGSNVFSDFVNDILSSLHFDSFNWKPSAQDFVTNSSMRDCIELVPFLSTYSTRVVSSTYFQMFMFATLRSLIIIRNNQGPSLSPGELLLVQHAIPIHNCGSMSPFAFYSLRNPRSSTSILESHTRRGFGLGHDDQLNQRLCESQTA